MSGAEKRKVRRAVARLRRLTLWTRRMARRRGGFLIVMPGVPREDIPAVPFLSVIRETNAPSPMRILFATARRAAA